VAPRLFYALPYETKDNDFGVDLYRCEDGKASLDLDHACNQFLHDIQRGPANPPQSHFLDALVKAIQETWYWRTRDLFQRVHVWRNQTLPPRIVKPGCTAAIWSNSKGSWWKQTESAQVFLQSYSVDALVDPLAATHLAAVDSIPTASINIVERIIKDAASELAAADERALSLLQPRPVHTLKVITVPTSLQPAVQPSGCWLYFFQVQALIAWLPPVQSEQPEDLPEQLQNKKE
jgi:hypothetical protein